MKRVIALFTLALLSQFSWSFSYTVEITEAELQSKVAAMMPIEKSKLFVTTTLSNPVVTLGESDDQIATSVLVNVKAPGNIKGSAHVATTGSLIYKAKEGAFYLGNPKIVGLTSSDIPESLVPKIKELSQSALAKILSSRPIYKLKDDNMKHQLAKSVLKSIKVKDHKLLIELSAF